MSRSYLEQLFSMAEAFHQSAQQTGVASGEVSSAMLPRQQLQKHFDDQKAQKREAELRAAELAAREPTVRVSDPASKTVDTPRDSMAKMASDDAAEADPEQPSTRESQSGGVDGEADDGFCRGGSVGVVGGGVGVVGGGVRGGVGAGRLAVYRAPEDAYAR